MFYSKVPRIFGDLIESLLNVTYCYIGVGPSLCMVCYMYNFLKVTHPIFTKFAISM